MNFKNAAMILIIYLTANFCVEGTVMEDLLCLSYKERFLAFNRTSGRLFGNEFSCEIASDKIILYFRSSGFTIGEKMLPDNLYSNSSNLIQYENFNPELATKFGQFQPFIVQFDETKILLFENAYFASVSEDHETFFFRDDEKLLNLSQIDLNSEYSYENDEFFKNGERVNHFHLPDPRMNDHLIIFLETPDTIEYMFIYKYENADNFMADQKCFFPIESDEKNESFAFPEGVIEDWYQVFNLVRNCPYDIEYEGEQYRINDAQCSPNKTAIYETSFKDEECEYSIRFYSRRSNCYQITDKKCNLIGKLIIIRNLNVFLLYALEKFNIHRKWFNF